MSFRKRKGNDVQRKKEHGSKGEMPLKLASASPVSCLSEFWAVSTHTRDTSSISSPFLFTSSPSGQSSNLVCSIYLYFSPSYSVREESMINWESIIEGLCLHGTCLYSTGFLQPRAPF
jgi:hypothetical protein